MRLNVSSNIYIKKTIVPMIKGSFLGDLTINAGWGWASTAWVGIALAFIGFLVWWYILNDERRATHNKLHD